MSDPVCSLLLLDESLDDSDQVDDTIQDSFVQEKRSGPQYEQEVQQRKL